MEFSGSTPPAGIGNTSSGGLQQAGGLFGRASPSFSMGAHGSNGIAAPSNPFAAFKKPSQTTQDKPSPAPFNPFATKAPVQPAPPPTSSSIFARGSSPAATQLPNPFQAALHKTQASPAVAPATSSLQPAASPFGAFGVPSQGQGSTAPLASNPFAGSAQQQPQKPAASSSFTTLQNTPVTAHAQNPFSQAVQSHGQTPSAKNDAPGLFNAVSQPALSGNPSVKFAPVTQTAFSPAPSMAHAAGKASFPPTNLQGGAFSAMPNSGKGQGNFLASTGSQKQGFQLASHQGNGPQSEYAERIKKQLRKDNINPPPWPSEPGNPANRMAMETYRENYKKYRDQARASLIKGGLIDDPEVRKRLDEAIDFKGICEDMCPEFEKISRIVQYDVKMAEKSEGSDGTMWASPSLMVKALARSAAGQEAPLPMDVRSVSSLKRTLDYLIDTILGDDSRLPTMHNFLWDRTRAIRRDFVFHSTMSDDEMLEQVYCLENITRFHTVALHLLSQKGFAAEDFSEQQEIEQLGKALLSLMQSYNDCRDKGIVCSNEAEFRAYFILLNAHDPDFQSKVSEWGTNLWNDSDDIQTALTLVQAMQSVWDWRGPLKPHVPTATALGAFTTYFRIVESPQVSYMMACVAEIFFVHVRRGILRNTVRAYARIRDSPKDLTVAVLNAMLRFDTDEEARDFVTQHNLEFSSDTVDGHLILDKTVHIGNPTVRQSYSQKLVERKRSGRPLPEAIHNTLFEKEGPAQNSLHFANEGTAAVSASVLAVTPSDASNSLFVDPSPSTTLLADKTTNSSGAFATPAVASNVASAAVTANPSSTSVFSFPTTQLSGVSPSGPSTQWTAATATDNSSSKRKEADQEKHNDTGRRSFVSLFQTGDNKEQSRNGLDETKTSSTTAASGNALFAPLSSSKAPFSPFQQTPAASPSSQSASTKAVNPFASNSLPKPPSSTSSASVPQKDETLATPSQSIFAPAAAQTPVLGTTASPSNVSTARSFFDQLPSKPSQVEKAAAALLSSNATPSAEATGQSIFSQKAATQSQSAFQKPHAATPSQQSIKTDTLGDFNRWVVLGDDGILDEFKVAFVEHLVQQASAQFQHEEEERVRQEEDERSWAEALRFKTYNLRVKYFYRWRNIARERALDRRARQARDDMRAYRAAKRTKQRVTAEKAAEQAAAEAHERAAEMRRLNSREVQFLEELGYYGTFGASSRKRKATRVGNDSSGEGVREATDADMAIDEETAKQREEKRPELQKLPVRQSLKDSLSSTVARTKELLTRSRSDSYSGGRGEPNGRASLGSLRGLASPQSAQGRESLDNGSISGDSVRSGASVRSIGSLNSIGDKMVAYYRRSVPGKSRTSSIFTRVPLPPTQAPTTATPKKTTNFMRYRSNSISNSNSYRRSPSLASNSRHGAGGPLVGDGDGGGSRSGSPALSHLSTSGANGAGYQSNVRSSYWRLRALGLVQMPNKQYLHESLALPMLQDGKRFRGVGNYGLPPVPTWDESKTRGEAAREEEGQEEEDEEQEEEQAALGRTETYAEERLRRSLAAASARKRVFSGGHDGARVPGAGGHSDGANGGTKKPKVHQTAVEGDTGAMGVDEVDETERVIREMHEMADAMDQGRDWFREQTEQLKKGGSIWGQ